MTSKRQLQRVTFWLLCVIFGLALVAWWHGLAADSHRPQRSHWTAQGSSPAPTSSVVSAAPWATAYLEYRNGNYAKVVANARNAPELGSFGAAIKALRECMKYPDPDARHPAIKFAEAQLGEPTPRRDAYYALRRPCEGLGTHETLSSKVNQLSAEAEAIGDPLFQLEQWERKLADRNAPFEERQELLQRLLAFNDPAAMQAAMGGLIFGTIDGEALGRIERAAYLVAWQQVFCAGYGECMGPDTRDGHKDCLYRGDCRYLDFEAQIDRWMPGLLGNHVFPYYLRIQAHLDRRRYHAFTVPRSF